jgi:hypothetical protein
VDSLKRTDRLLGADMMPDYTSICAEVVEMIRRGDSSVPRFFGNDWRKVGLEWVFRFDVFCFTRVVFKFVRCRFLLFK